MLQISLQRLEQKHWVGLSVQVRQSFRSIAIELSCGDLPSLLIFNSFCNARQKWTNERFGRKENGNL